MTSSVGKVRSAQRRLPGRLAAFGLAASTTAVLVVGGGATAGAASHAAATKSPYVIHVVNATTGPAAAPGGQNKVALNGYATYLNQHGGLEGHPLQFQFSNNQSTPSVAVSLASPIIAQHPPIMFNGGVGATDAAVDALITSPSDPIVFDMSPVAALKKGGNVFGSAASAITQWLVILTYAKNKGWKRVGLLNATDTSGTTVTNALLTAFKEKKYKSLDLVDHETYTPSAVSVSTQVAKIAAANPQVLLVPETGATIEVALKGIQQTPSLATVPVFGTSADITSGLIHHFGSIVPKHFGASGEANLAGPTITNLKKLKPTKGVLNTIKTFFKFTTKTTPSSGSYQLAWDAAAVAVAALKHEGLNASPAKLRKFISHLKNFNGAGGKMNYVANPQRGLGATSVPVFEWNPTSKSVVPVSLPGGKPIK